MFFFQIKGAWCARVLSFSRKYFAVFRKSSPTLSARITEGLNNRTVQQNGISMGGRCYLLSWFKWHKYTKNLHVYCEKTMHMSVCGTKNLCLPTLLENLNLCSDFSQKKNEKSISGVCACACACERVCMCVLGGSPDRNRGGSWRFRNFNVKGDWMKWFLP